MASPRKNENILKIALSEVQKFSLIDLSIDNIREIFTFIESKDGPKTFAYLAQCSKGLSKLRDNIAGKALAELINIDNDNYTEENNNGLKDFNAELKINTFPCRFNYDISPFGSKKRLSKLMFVLNNSITKKGLASALKRKRDTMPIRWGNDPLIEFELQRMRGANEWPDEENFIRVLDNVFDSPLYADHIPANISIYFYYLCECSPNLIIANNQRHLDMWKNIIIKNYNNIKVGILTQENDGITGPYFDYNAYDVIIVKRCDVGILDWHEGIDRTNLGITFNNIIMTHLENPNNFPKCYRAINRHCYNRMICFVSKKKNPDQTHLQRFRPRKRAITRDLREFFRCSDAMKEWPTRYHDVFFYSQAVGKYERYNYEKQGYKEPFEKKPVTIVSYE